VRTPTKPHKQSAPSLFPSSYFSFILFGLGK
jgi:hypothetical protein